MPITLPAKSRSNPDNSNCPPKNPGYEIDMSIYSVENSKQMYTDDSYMTEFTTK